MSDLIAQTARPNRKARLAHRALGPKLAPNMQRRPNALPPAAGAGVVPGPTGPALLVNLADGQQIPLPLTPDQARQFGVALIGMAAQMEQLKAMAAEEAPAEPVPTTPDLEQLLAEAQEKTAGPILLPSEEPAPSGPAPNTFDIYGRPVYEPPTD